MPRKRISAASVERALVWQMPVIAMSLNVDSCLLVHVGVLILHWKHFSPMPEDRFTKCQNATKPIKKGTQLGLHVV